MKIILVAFCHIFNKIFYLYISCTEYNIFFEYIDNVFYSKYTHHKYKTYHIYHYVFSA